MTYGTNQLGMPILTLTLLVPLASAILAALVPGDRKNTIRWIAVIGSGVNLMLAAIALASFRFGTDQIQLVERWIWAPSLNLQYYLGIDGISVLLYGLTALLSFIAIVYSFGVIDYRIKEYYVALLVLETGMLGVFVALDLLLFYVFFELTLIPMALLIGVWGHGRKLYSAVKFFLYTLAGSLIMLAAIASIYVHTSSIPNGPTLNYVDLLRIAPNWSYAWQVWMFWGFFFAFAIKVPLFPFHTWLPDAHVDAPTAGSILLAGVLLKMGGYGFLRWLLPLAPEASRDLAVIPITLSVIAILYGALVTLVQRDLKKLVAYSSVASMGFVVLGIFIFNLHGAQGAIVQMVSHGFISGALFLGVGVIYERLHTREIAKLGGLATLMGPFASLWVMLSLANLGLPGFSAFVGEVLVTLGTWLYKPWLAFPVYAYIILSAAYMLWMVARVFYLGKPESKVSLPPMNIYQEALPLVVLVGFSFVLGVWATPFLRATEPSLVTLLGHLGVSTAASIGIR
ncbi:proton-translocating NADH-quinone oxidoreductase, chain M [Thermobaculum terrenum ATCC BAA-798]|uniref:Proton-translocating NADH-quinone oxidoreductase, chain M n=1 Tax=Thermobaculum terrenum (strain ATCC BAA-798 / CCMEE 7001 / YNP1) TaxID=525904 RepID=D1CCC3_THET1|nr:NADH-quinone oxidoreductase subunit M [Thermobaculum terrenum]ACZ42438.1 proton-translocating NADH-quinone oxidoreductase, chain M [Thermobaculum terrenum ATCC BAA-798]